MGKIKEILEYREMVKMLVKRNLRGRYKNSFFGFAWTFMNPLFQLVVYTLLFSVILRSDIEQYALFLFVALIPWMAFSGAVNDGSASIITQGNLVTKIYFPRQILPLVTTLNNFVNMLLCMIIVLFVCLITKGIDFTALLFLIPVILIEFILAFGISLMVSGITVYVRDVQHILGIVMMAWNFLTPVVYPIETVPDRLRGLFMLNPMTPIILAYRDILFYKRIPQMSTMAGAFAAGCIFVIAGWVVFDALEKHFAEAL